MNSRSLDSEVNIPKSDFVALGKFGSAWGVKGELKLYLYNIRSENLKVTRRFYYCPAGFSFEPLDVLSLKAFPKMWVVKFKNFSSPESVKKLIDKEFFIPKQKLITPKAADEFYAFELQDFVVNDDKGKCFGKVRNVLHYGASDLLEIFNEETQTEQLIPLVNDFVLKIDRSLKKILVSWDEAEDHA